MLAHVPAFENSCSLTLICEVVTQAEHKLWCCIAVFKNQSLGNLTFVDEPWADFKVGLACHDLDIVLLSYGLLEVLLALACLEGAKLGISLAVMPGKCNLLLLDEGT